MLINIKRLSTRDIRENLPTVRKRLWLIEIFTKKCVLLLVSKKYSKIYDKYFAAITKTKSTSSFLPNEIVKIPGFRLYLLSWCGENLTVIFKDVYASQRLDVIFRVLDGLVSLNSISVQRLQKPMCLRYIDLFLEESEKLGISDKLILKLKRRVDEVKRDGKAFCGLGVEDAVLSNFTYFKDSVHLVDLDNYSDSVNLYYEMGFLMADLEIEHQFSLQQTRMFCLDYVKAKSLQQDFKYNYYVLGKVSRYSIAVLNLASNKKYYYGIKRDRALRRINEELDSRSY